MLGGMLVSTKRRKDLFELMRDYIKDWETFADELLESAIM